MLEFNVDKQGGIKLHTCDRKNRWCKFWLWLSWVSILALLGWLFWSGFLTFDKQEEKGSVVSTPLAKAPIATPEVKMVMSDCPKLDSSEVAETVKNKEFEESCNEKLSALNLQLKEVGELKDTNQKLKTSAELLKKSNTELLKEKQELGTKLADKTLQSEKLIKQLSVPSSEKSSDPDLVEKLYYYENILGVNGDEQAVIINHFVLKKLQKTRRYRLQLVLGYLGRSQSKSGTEGSYDVFLKGNKRIDVMNEADDKSAQETGSDSANETKPITVKKEAVTYKHTDLIPAGEPEVTTTFAFKYYQSLESEIVLPEFFELESVSVGISPQGLPSVKKNYQWADLEKLSFKEIK